MLESLAGRFVADRYDLDRRRRYLAENVGFSSDNWTQLGEMGLLGLPFAEEYGGFGGGPVELMVVFEALGRGLVVEPLAPNLLLAGGLLARSADRALKAEWLPRLIAAETRLAFAHAEHASRFRDDRVAVTAGFAQGTWILEGAKTFVLAPLGAEAFLVSARDAAGEIGVYLVDADAENLKVRPYRVIDGTIAAELRLDGVATGTRLGIGLEAIGAAQDDARLASCAEMFGIMSRLFSDTLDYVRGRSQFGGPIGGFQAIQHRLADVYAQLELARSHLLRAVLAKPTGRPRAIAEAKAFIAERALHLGEECIQLHGGMGVSDELIIGHGHKRLMLLATLFGDSEAEMVRLNGLGR